MLLVLQAEGVTSSLKINLEAKLSANYCEDGVWFKGPCQQGSRSLCPYTSDLELSLFMSKEDLVDTQDQECSRMLSLKER